MKFLEKYSKLLDIVEKILRVILIVLLGGMVLIMFYQTIMRYVFNNAQVWCEELALYMGVYCTLLGISIATRRESHLQVDFLLSFYTPRIKCLVTGICSIVAIVIMVFFCYYSVRLMGVAVGKSPTLPLTMRDIYMVFPIGSVLVILFSLENIIRNFIGFKNNGVMPDLKGGKAE